MAAGWSGRDSVMAGGRERQRMSGASLELGYEAKSRAWFAPKEFGEPI